MSMAAAIAEPINPARVLLRSLAAEIYRPRPKISVSEWADTYRVLSGETSASAGPWRTGYVPYTREPMDMAGDQRVTDITLMWAAQLGKTEVVLNMMFYAADVLGQSQIIMYPTEDDIKEFRNKRLEPSIMATRQVARLLASGTGRSAITDSGVRFRGMNLDFAWAQSDRTQKGKARPWIYCDEIDEYPREGALARLRNRSKTFTHPKFISISTPTDEGVGIDRVFKTGDRRRYNVPCPHCGEFQVLTFGRLRWEGGIAAPRDEVMDSTWYECPVCLERIEERFKSWMIARGVWVPEGCMPPQPAQDAAQPRAQRTDVSARPEYPVPRHVSYQLSELYSPFPSATWGGIAVEFIDHKGVPPRVFYTERLAEAYAVRGKRIEPHALQALCVARKDGGYLKREIPAECRVLLAGIDVQHNRFYYLCRGFGARAEKTWLIDEREIYFQPGLPMQQIEEFIRSVRYEQVQGGSGSGASPAAGPVGGPEKKPAGIPWRPVAWAIDSGDQTRDVYEGVVVKFSPSRPDPAGGTAVRFPLVYATKGRGAGQLTEVSQPFTVSMLGEVGKDKKRLSAQVHLINVNTLIYKNAIDTEWRGDPRMGLLTNEHGEAVGAVRSYLPADTSKAYLEHITSEEYKVISERARGGWGTMGWMKKPGVMRNDYLDLEVYVRALADKLKVSQAQRINTGFAMLAPNTPGKATAADVGAPRRTLKVSR